MILLIIASLISGRVFDSEGEPIPGANVFIQGTELGAATDQDGWFKIKDVSPGVYTVVVSFIGYRRKVITDVVVTGKRPAVLEVHLEEEALNLGGATIIDDYFVRETDNPAGSFVLSYEEIRRTTGASEDISRITHLFPGVTAPSDDRNDLVVRGGSPLENGFYVDGIRIPNPNHFSSPGSGGGPIGFLQTYFVKELDVLTGGFPAKFGDALSSVIDVKWRNGTSGARIYTLDLSMAGAGVILDGTIGDAGYMFSGRRSYLFLLERMGVFDLEGVPEYWDIQGKISLPFSNGRIDLVGIDSDSWINITGFGSGEGTFDIWNRSYQYAGGVSCRWGIGNGVISIYLYRTRNNYHVDTEVRDTLVYFNRSYEVRNTMHAEWENSFDKVKLTVGLEPSILNFRHRVYVRNEVDIDSDTTTWSGSLFLQSNMKKGRWALNTGIRFDYLDITEKYSISPRCSFSWEMNPVTYLNLSAGLYTQHPQPVWLTSNIGGEKLEDIKCIQFVGGIEHLIKEDVKLKIEAYTKYYRNYPVDTVDSTRILANEGASYEGFINFHPLSSQGKGSAHGMDLVIQKKFTHGNHFLLSYSYIKTGFIPLDGKTYPSVYEVPHTLDFEAGFTPLKNFEIGIRFGFACGRKYFPIDSLASATQGYTVRDYSRMETYPPYHRLDIRIERREFKKHYSVVWYFEIDNVYGRKNIRDYYWDDTDKTIKTAYQWGFMPVGGCKIEF